MPKRIIKTVNTVKESLRKILKRTVLITIGIVFNLCYNGYDYFVDTGDKKLIAEQQIDLKKAQEREAALTIANTSLLVRVSKNSKWSNSSAWAEWVKEYNPRTKEIVMEWYNRATYKYILKPLGFDLYYYILKTDFDVFTEEMASQFYNEEMELVNRFLEGDGTMVIQYYDKPWTNLNGVVDKNGYWRYVWQEEGHIYVGGRTDKPVIFSN